MNTVPPAEGPDEGPDSFRSSIPDEQWAAFLRAAAEDDGSAAPKEPSARARMVARRLRERSASAADARPRPRRPARPSPREVLQAVVPWLVAAAVLLYGAWQWGLLSWGDGSDSAESGPARAVALPGGGVTDGAHCGEQGYHYFPLPAAASAPAPQSAEGQPGPQLTLGSYGYEKLSGRTPGSFGIGLLFAPGTHRPLVLSRDLHGEGVAVEIEGPHGLVAGAHGLPVTWAAPGKAGGADRQHIDVTDGGGGEITLPLTALCPGYDAETVTEGLRIPTDSSNTITGQPAYTLTVSVREPAVGTLRTAVGLPAGGGLLSANNLVPDGP
ncbi:hypothetical protein [Streptomyces sp. NPDC127190]|uniref:hypothetical protein n=1 Tax=unclassified Streptomyces TaxID=2593676 RepID=UPI00363F9D49